MKDNLIFKLKILSFKYKEALALFKRDKKNNFLLEECIEETSFFILNKKNNLAYFKNSENKEIQFLIKEIRNYSVEVLGILEKIKAIEVLNFTDYSFKYEEQLILSVQQEIKDYSILKESQVLFVGSGAMPITAYTIAKETEASISCLDIDPEAIRLSKKVTDKLKLINIFFEDNIENLNLSSFSHIIIASLVPEKCEILDYITKKTGKNTKIILRYGNGLKEIFNFPLCIKIINNYTKTVIRDQDFIYDSLLLERD